MTVLFFALLPPLHYTYVVRAATNVFSNILILTLHLRRKKGKFFWH